MTRDQAIKYLWMLQICTADHDLWTKHEWNDDECDLIDALLTLGVKRDELPSYLAAVPEARLTVRRERRTRAKVWP